MNKSVYLYELDSVRNSKEDHGIPCYDAMMYVFSDSICTGTDVPGNYTEWEPGDPDHESVSGFSCISCCD